MAAGAASDRFGLPLPSQALALSHFRLASRSAPHRTGRQQDKPGFGPGDRNPRDLMLMNGGGREKAVLAGLAPAIHVWLGGRKDIYPRYRLLLCHLRRST